VASDRNYDSGYSNLFIYKKVKMKLIKFLMLAAIIAWVAIVFFSNCNDNGGWNEVPREPTDTIKIDTTKKDTVILD
jgi:hypothetical protein